MKMNYQQAIEESLNRRWKIGTCSEGEKCWCRTIRCEDPLMFTESVDSEEEEYHVVRSGELNKETVEHLVRIHNQQVESNKSGSQSESEAYSPYCPVCTACGESGCCSPQACQQDPNGLYCEGYLRDLKFGYAMNVIFEEEFSESLSPEDKERYDQLWDQNYDKFFVQNKDEKND